MKAPLILVSLILAICTSLLFACNLQEQTHTVTTQQFTPTPRNEHHFVKVYGITIEFDYPENWELVEGDTGYSFLLQLHGPPDPEEPTPDPNVVIFDGEPSYDPWIYIECRKFASFISLDSFVDNWISGLDVIVDRSIELDGIPARELTIRNDRQTGD